MSQRRGVGYPATHLDSDSLHIANRKTLHRSFTNLTEAPGRLRHLQTTTHANN